MTTERDRLRVDAVGALIQARNDLLEVGNDYPGSSCQKWCTERAANAWNALKPWRHCPSTHCERAEECRSVNECSAEKSTARAFLTAERDRILASQERAIADAVAAERERCAVIAENHSFGMDIGDWLVATKKEISARACVSVATAIRNHKGNEHG